ncbi:MAG: BamA/TamA family outer membrane protein [Bacteroidota bacterium]|nr:BamA/TamA family outer membrane protein [Bacteroidota bacterium]
MQFVTLEPMRCCIILCLVTVPVVMNAQNPSGLIVPPRAQVRDTSGQRDLIGLVKQLTHLHIKKPAPEKGRKVYYSLLPIGSSVPGGGTALVTSTQAAFYLGERKTTYISNITFSPSTNFKGQFNLPFRGNIWLPGNRWNLQGDMRYSFFPQKTWGLGGNHADDDPLLIDYSYFRFYLNGLKRIRPYFFAGIGYALDYHLSIESETDSMDLQKYTGYAYGTGPHGSSFSSGITFNLLYDARINSINPLPGYYYNLVYRINPRFLGSGDNWNSLYADVRKYIPFSRREQNTLALWTYFWTVLGSKAPYLSLPALGWDSQQRSGRGFYNRRYAGTSLWYLEAEYRRQITNDGLLGFVVFSNLNSVTEQNSRKFAYLHPAAGAGARIKFNKNSGTNLAIDFAVSDDYKAIYLALGEAF